VSRYQEYLPANPLLRKYRDDLEARLESPEHSHSRWRKWPWWKWRLHWSNDEYDKGFWLEKGERYDEPCDGELDPRDSIKFEMEREMLGTKMIASRQSYCSKERATVIMYCAVLVSEEAMRSFAG
jgi:hypothetical protein